MIKLRKVLFFLIVAGLLALGFAQQVLAIPTLMISATGAAPIMLQDNDGDGVVSFVGAVGTWTFNLTMGATMPSVGSAAALGSFNFYGSGSGTLTIMFSENFFGSGVAGDGGDYNYTTNFAGASSANTDLTLATFADSGNNLFGNTNLGSIDYEPTAVSIGQWWTGSGGFFGTESGTVSGLTSDFSITQSITITTQDTGLVSIAGLSTSMDSMAHTPEPETLLLLGSGLVALGITARRKKLKATKT